MALVVRTLLSSFKRMRACVPVPTPEKCPVVTKLGQMIAELAHLKVEETIDILGWSMCVPIVGMVWGFLVKATLLALRQGDSLCWTECWQQRDISELFQESYYVSVFLMAITCCILFVQNYLHYKTNLLNEHMSSKTVASTLLVFANLAVVFLFGILLFTQDGNYIGHMLSAVGCFTCFIVYFLGTAFFFGKRIWNRTTGCSMCNLFTVVYQAVLPVLMIVFLKWWRQKHCVCESEWIVMDPSGSRYEWLAVLCIYMWYLGFTPMCYCLRKKRNSLRC